MEIPIEEYEIYIRPGFTDMRNGASGLASIVENSMNMSPFSKAIFVFCSKSHKTVRAILWHGNGWLTITKKLECSSSFKWPNTPGEARLVTFADICGLLKGQDVWRKFETFTPVWN